MAFEVGLSIDLSHSLHCQKTSTEDDIASCTSGNSTEHHHDDSDVDKRVTTMVMENSTNLKPEIQNEISTESGQFSDKTHMSSPSKSFGKCVRFKETILSSIPCGATARPTESESAKPPKGKVLKDQWTWLDPVSCNQFVGQKKTVCYEELQRQRKRLPIYQYREQFVNAVRFRQVVVVVGETGCGKSTQMPQYLLESGLINGKIAVTQPRRVAAVSVAARVADEIGCACGEFVGYSIRFEDVTSSNTIVKYMTDGLLVMECLRDPGFNAYGCVILDEAHERTLHTDVLLGLLKKALKRRPELKVIVTSATLDIKKFANYFDAPMVKIPGKLFPVNISYLPELSFNYKTNLALWTKAKKTDLYIEEAVAKVLAISTSFNMDQVSLGMSSSCKKRDILLFLPGREEVEHACYLISKSLEWKEGRIIALPVYGALPFEAQCEIFNSAPSGVCKVIVATNIAETSITVDGILYVVDVGLFKESYYDRGIDTLKVTVISKAQADQRAGRAGRTAPGLCFRLYKESDYAKMIAVPAPAIHRTDFTSTALQLKAMGIDDICGFDFMDPPKKDCVMQALKRLRSLEALDENFEVTPLGYQMAEFPLLPNLSKILLTAAMMECSEEVLTIVSMLSVKNVFVRCKKKLLEADRAKKSFNDPCGDHLTLLNVFEAWMKNYRSENWSKKNFLHQKELELAFNIRSQLHGLMKLHGVPLISTRNSLSNIRKALSTGEPSNIACLYGSRGNAYRTFVNNQTVFIHPSSALYKCRPPPKLVIYHETITTSRNFIRIVSICERAWLDMLHGITEAA